MTYPIAMIPYTNMAPYRELGPPAGCCFETYVPRESIEALVRGRVLAAAVPVGGLAAVAHITEPIGWYGIGARERSMSVLFFSDRPFAEMNAAASIRVTDESASSVRLLCLLLGYRNGFDHMPRIAAPDERASGELLIGDAALLRMEELKRAGPDRKQDLHVTDLATEWFAAKSLPFVFARWVIRKDAPAAARTALGGWLADFRSREPELVRRAAPAAADRLGVSRDQILDYFQVIRRSLDESDLAGQKKFLEALKTYPVEGSLFSRPN